MNEAKPIIIAKLKCPRCGKVRIIRINRDDFYSREVGGLVKLVFHHGDHVFAVWVDVNGTQRSVEVYDVSGEKKEKGNREMISIGDLIRIIGLSNISRIFAATLGRMKISLPFQGEKRSMLEFLFSHVLGEYPRISDRANKSSSIMIENFTLNQMVPGEEYFLRALQKIISLDDVEAQYLRLQIAIDRVKELAENIRKEVEFLHGIVSILELKKRFNVKDNDLFKLVVLRVINSDTKIRDKIREKRYFLPSF